jgi:hypothetical protein
MGLILRCADAINERRCESLPAYFPYVYILFEFIYMTIISYLHGGIINTHSTNVACHQE